MSSDASPRLGLPDMPETPELYPDIVADAFARLDAFTDLYLKGQFVNTPPSSPADGDAYLTGGAPSGAWSGQAYKIATCRDGAWTILTPFNGLRAHVATTGAFIVYADGAWTDWAALIGAGETSIASAATCDICAAGSLFVAVTGTTAITSFGTSANRLRFVRFAGTLTLTHHATSLVLPGGANIVTAAGDTAILASDGSGNWRCRHYSRADGRMVNMASPVFTGTMGLPGGGAITDTFMGIGASSGVASLTGSIVQAYGASPARLIAATTGRYATLNLRGGASSTHTTFDITLDDTANFASIGTGTATPTAFTYDGSEIGRISSSSFLVNSTTNGGGIGAKIVSYNNGGNGITSTVEGGAGKYAYDAHVTSTSDGFCQFRYNGTGVGSITCNGSATLYNTTSDARLKTVLPEQRDYRNAIRALWVGDFTWKQGGMPGFGVLAQQAYAVMPHHQGVTPAADEDGTWTASAEPFAHLALWGVKDIYALIETLAARVAALEAAHAG